MSEDTIQMVTNQNMSNVKEYNAICVINMKVSKLNLLKMGLLKTGLILYKKLLNLTY